MIAGTDSGIFISNYYGNTWKKENSGLPQISISSIGVDSSGYIFVGTLGGGIYRSAQSITKVQVVSGLLPTYYSLSQNYPNPFNPSTSISYSIPKQTQVQLQVYNLLGQLIATLVDESKQPGTYTVTWDASTRSSGLYFYRMTAGEFVETKKAILLK
jgi:hypothetical protein